MNGDRIWILLGKRASGEISAAEQSELASLLEEDPETAAAQTFLTEIWNKPLEELPTANTAHARIWSKIHAQINPIRRWRPGRIAAVAAGLALLAGWVSWKLVYPDANVPLRQVTSPIAGKSKIELPDGTNVWLNRNSSLAYGKEFGKYNRELTLSGEAFFDVTPNKDLPFIIHAASVNITVIGTAFNVKAYATDKTVSTTLIRGKVAVSLPQQSDKTIVLKPDEKITIPVTGQEITRYKIHKDSAGNIPEISWMNTRLVFDDEPFGALSVKMGKWYGVDFHFEDTQLQQLKFSGVIDTEPINEALNALQLSRHFTFRITGKDIWISK